MQRRPGVESASGGIRGVLFRGEAERGSRPRTSSKVPDVFVHSASTEIAVHLSPAPDLLASRVHKGRPVITTDVCRGYLLQLRV